MQRDDRERMKQHRGMVVWLTGLSGSGKSTLSGRLEASLLEAGYHTYLLDGDNLRHGLNRDLDFSPESRCENIRRAGEVAALMLDAGLVVVCAFVSPYAADRRQVRCAVGAGSFFEVHVKANLDVCRSRDPKGLYRLQSLGKLHGLTGVDAPYEVPEHPDLVLDTSVSSEDQSAAALFDALVPRLVHIAPERNHV